MVKIRLARAGAKKRPFYHLVASDSRSPRDGRFIERLGFFNPIAVGGEVRLRVNTERVDHWGGLRSAAQRSGGEARRRSARAALAGSRGQRAGRGGRFGRSEPGGARRRGGSGSAGRGRGRIGRRFRGGRGVRGAGALLRSFPRARRRVVGSGRWAAPPWFRWVRLAARTDVRGWVRVRSDMDPPEDLLRHHTWLLERAGRWAPVAVRSAGRTGTPS